jgi:hypothetical protein
MSHRIWDAVTGQVMAFDLLEWATEESLAVWQVGAANGSGQLRLALLTQ